ncbi:MAG: hypothetical protein IPK57_19000 [Chitinophagaceae bacterium]|nr:hypothetical protein [Chitinophagaceae bacterium]
MKSVLKKYEVLNDKEENLRYSWNAFAVHLDKPRALWFAYNGQKFWMDRFSNRVTKRNY